MKIAERGLVVAAILALTLCAMSVVFSMIAATRATGTPTQPGPTGGVPAQTVEPPEECEQPTGGTAPCETFTPSPPVPTTTPTPAPTTRWITPSPRPGMEEGL